MQLDAICTHTDSHTLMQDRCYRARFSYKFPKGNTRRHQLSGALLLCFPSLLVSFPLSITHSASFILFFSASSTILFIHWPLNCSWSFHHFLTFNNSHLSRNESFFFFKEMIFICLSANCFQHSVYKCICVEWWNWTAAVKITELWGELWCTLHQLHIPTPNTPSQTGAFHPISLIRS